MLLENKVAVIYGAGGPIGGAVARAFARAGYCGPCGPQYPDARGSSMRRDVRCGTIVQLGAETRKSTTASLSTGRGRLP